MKFRSPLSAAVAALFLAVPVCAAGAGGTDADKMGPALAAPLAAGTTSQISLQGQEPGFDALSAAGDPLYREGSRELLKKAAKGETPAKAALRDAPNSAPSPKLRKPRAKKPVHADPVRGQNAI